jgi:TonB family protein
MRAQASTPSRRRWAPWLGLAVSLVLHGAALTWLPVAPEQEASWVVSPPQGSEVTVELVELPQPASQVTSPEVEVERDGRANTPPRMKRALVHEDRPQAGSPDGVTPSRPGAQTGSGLEPQAGAEAPRLRTLLPDGAAVFGDWGPPANSPGSAGRTIINQGPPTAQEQRARAEASARQVGQRVTAWARDDLAEVRVRSGAADHYFREVGKAMERLAQLERPHAFDLQGGVQRNMRSYLHELESYGATGAPGPPPPGSPGRTGQPDPQGMHHIAEATAEQSRRLRHMIDQFAGNDLVVVMELVQDAQGRIHQVRVVQSSGDAAFDEHLAQVAARMDLLPGMPDHVVARSPDGVRTTWEFRGRYSFLKKLREMEMNNVGDAAYLAAMGLGSLLAGLPFEETTLDLYVIDVRDPKFTVRSRLLRLY